ncbi:Cocaine esterase [Toxocara canis]|uniref:Cocaine esterase n=1 Tax=Toxocara canis TaxID=6265 RepID=A0A0B2VTH1_TOXCA|nr:Cocaine esterase [Toxocara canis]
MPSKIAFCILCCFYSALVTAWPQPSDLSLRKLSTGQIRGKYIVTSRNTSGYVFLGIPYAEPPLGKLRYRAPRAVRPWKGVIEVKQYRNSCLWNSSITSNIAEFTRMSEDCLTVNVFTNAKCLLKGKCAVVYMIHGGDYNFDSPMLYPVDFLVDNFAPEERSVIVVTVTYRLGSFGFLNLSPNLKSSAVKNIGLLDMIEGLRWVQKEISNLGGDPNRVTVMGHSSGAVNAHQLTVSPLTKGLFNQAIIMSGLLGIPTPPNNGQRVSEQFAIKAGCADEKFDDRDAKTVEAVLDCLRKINGKKLLAIQRLIEDDGFTFQGPCVDGPGGVLPKTVEELMKTARPIKMMIGTVEKEMQNTDYLLCKDGSVDRKGVKATCAAVTAMFGYRKKREASRTCTQEYVKPYKTPYIVDDPGFFVNAALYSEALIGAGGRVFLYQFNYANVGDAFYLGPLVPKYTQAQTPHHTQEFVYIVGIHMGNFTEKDEIIRVKFSQLLIDFVNKGDPSSSTKQRWTELRPEIMNYFVIDFDEQNNMPGMKYAYHAHEIKFWNKTMLRNGGGRVPVRDEAVFGSEALVNVMGIPSADDYGSGTCNEKETSSSERKSFATMRRQLQNDIIAPRASVPPEPFGPREGRASASVGWWTVILIASVLIVTLSSLCAAILSKKKDRTNYEVIE